MIKKLIFLFTAVASLYYPGENCCAQKITTDTTKAFLVDNNVKVIAIDLQGNKWFGTENGLSKFDGVKWTTYSKEKGSVANCITHIVVDKKNNIWFSGITGLSKFDGKTFTTYTTSNGYPDDQVTAMAVDSSGNIWIAHQFNCSKFDGSKWTTKGFSETINALACDKKGNLWIATKKGLLMYDGEKWKDFSTEINLPDCKAIAFDAQGNKWFATYRRGVIKYDGTTSCNFKRADGLVSDSVTSIAIDAQGNKWFGTQNKGVSKFDDKNWTTITETNGLISNSIRDLAIDAQGNKWFGTKKGVAEFTDDKFLCYINPIEKPKPKTFERKYKRSILEDITVFPSVRLTGGTAYSKTSEYYQIGFTPIIAFDKWFGFKPYIDLGFQKFPTDNTMILPKLGLSTHISIFCIDMSYLNCTNFHEQQKFFSLMGGVSFMGILELTYGYDYKLSKTKKPFIDKDMKVFSITLNFPINYSDYDDL